MCVCARLGIFYSLWGSVWNSRGELLLQVYRQLLLLMVFFEANDLIVADGAFTMHRDRAHKSKQHNRKGKKNEAFSSRPMYMIYPPRFYKQIKYIKK